MNIIEPIMLGFDQIRVHKLRATLSILGILISVGSVTGIVSMGDGLRLTVMKQFEQSGGSSVIRIQPPQQWIREGSRWIRRSWEDYLTNDDAVTIAREIDHIKYMIPEIKTNNDIKFRQATANANVRASNEYYAEYRNWEIDHGRFVSTRDIADATKVAVIGAELAKDLYGQSEAVGKELKIGGSRYLVVGVMKSRKFFGEVNERYMVIPYTTAQKRFFGNNRLTDLMVYTDNPNNAAAIAAWIRMVLIRTHEHGEEFRVTTGEEEIGRFNRVVTIMKIVAGGIAGISLLVGGIGIMNIMLVSVTERTSEIGVRKAVGAKRSDIMIQFILEAMVLCLFGGILGIFLGLGLGAGISVYVKSLTKMPFESIVTPGLMMFAILYSAGVGLFFGVYPAWRASKLDPIKALSRE